MPRTEDDLSFFVYGDSINTDAFDNAQNSRAETGDSFSVSAGTQNMCDAAAAGTSVGENGASAGNGTSAGMGM